MPRGSTTKVRNSILSSNSDSTTYCYYNLFPNPGSLGRCTTDWLRLTCNQIIHSVETAGGVSRHDLVLRKRIKESILQNATNEDREIDEAELKRLVFLEESSKKVENYPTYLVILVYGRLTMNS